MSALNEEDKIEDTVRTIITAAGNRFTSYEILLVNDGSTDSTGTIMDRLAKENPRIRVLHNENNLGLGGSYRRAIGHASMDHVMWVSGDNAETADNLVNIISHLGEADIVIPVLLDQTNRPKFRQLTSRTFTRLVNLIFHLRIRYYNGAVLHRTALVRSIRIQTDSFAYQTEILVKLVRRGHTYVEIPYRSASYDGIFSYALRPKNLLGVFTAISRLFVQERLLRGRADKRA